jgi:two-component system phosphate regulon sensor histidine kinase PhoR
MTIALAFVAVMHVWFTPNDWILGSILVVAWAAINAFLLSRSVR